MRMVNRLLQKASALDYKFERMINLDKQKKTFNLFTVLFKGREEVELHTLFLFELLNPDGQHGKGEEFLGKFIDIDSLDLVRRDWPLKSCYVSREKDNIDILICCEKRAILIENKIDARDQDKQLERYYKFVRDDKGLSDENIEIVYLTLDGKAPSEKSLGDLDPDRIKKLSYKDHIIPWLNNCISISATDPELRESLVQYRNLLEMLTETSIRENHMNEMKDLLLENSGYLRAAIKLQEAIPLAQKEVERRFWRILNNVLEDVFQYEKEKYNLDDNWEFEDAKKNRCRSILLGEFDELPYQYIFEANPDGTLWMGFYYDHYEYGDLERSISRLRKVARDVDPSLKAQYDYWLGGEISDIFKTFESAACISIVDESNMEAYIAEIVEKAKTRIDKFEKILRQLVCTE